MALTRAAQEAIWLHQLLEQLGFSQDSATQLRDNNQGSIALAKNPGDHPHSKHIQLQYYFIHFAIDEGTIELDYIPTSQMPADGLTKSLVRTKHESFVKLLGMKAHPSGSVVN